MKKQLTRIVSITLAVMTVMSMLTCLPTFAAVVNLAASVNPNDGIVDNSDPNTPNGQYFPEIGDQKETNSCEAWANCYYQFTYTMNKKLGRKTTYENSFNPMWVYNAVSNGTDYGTTTSKVYSFLSQQGGLEIGTLPLDNNTSSLHPTQEYWEKSSQYRIEGFTNILKNVDTKDRVNKIKEALDGGDILTCKTYLCSLVFGEMPINPDFPENMKHKDDSIIKYSTNCMLGAHRLTIVGYNNHIWTDTNGDNKVTDDEMGAFKVANSMGKEWKDYWYQGENIQRSNDGFVWVAYKALESEIYPTLSDVTKINVQDAKSNSGIHFVYTLNTADRKHIEIDVKATDGIKTYTGKVTPFSISSDLGSLSLNGNSTADDGTLAYDLDNVVEGLNSNNFKNYRWEFTINDTNNDANSLIVKNLKIVDKNNSTEYKVSTDKPTTLNGSAKTFTYSMDAFNFDIIKGNLTNPNINTAQSYTFDVSGGVGPYTYDYSCASATIINNGSDCIAYFRKTGYNQLSVKATDSRGKTFSYSFFANAVDNPVKISSCYIPTAYIKQEATFDMSTLYETINTPTSKNPVSFTVKKDGVTVATPTVEYVNKDLSQLIGKYRAKWTPTSTGTYTATWKVTDAKGRVAEKTFTFNVNMQIVPTCNLYTTSNINTLYGVSFAARGEKGVYTYSYTCQNISDFSATAPTVTNNTSSCKIYFKSIGMHLLNVKITDSKGNVGTKSYFINVSDNPLKISGFTATDTRVNQEITFKASTTNETMYSATYQNPVSLIITQNGKTIATPTVNRTSKHPGSLTANYSASWTPTEKGSYFAIMSVTDYAGRTASRTYYFTVY